MRSEETQAKFLMALSMFIFGTIGIFRKFIPWPSAALACVRGTGGALTMVLFLLLRGKKLPLETAKGRLGLLILSGALIGFNWILLFDSYNYTSVATGTLCYYMAPVFVAVVSPFLFHKPMRLLGWICVAVSFAGMILISGVLNAGFDMATEGKGVLLGLSAAVLYAIVVLLNKQITGVDPFLRSVIQIGVAGTVLIPYVCAKGEWSGLELSPSVLIMVLLVCVIHTGVAYALYLGNIYRLNTQTIAIFSYIDPVMAVILSALLLKEPLGITGAVGAVMILGAMAVNELFDFRS